MNANLQRQERTKIHHRDAEPMRKIGKGKIKTSDLTAQNTEGPKNGINANFKTRSKKKRRKFARKKKKFTSSTTETRRKAGIRKGKKPTPKPRPWSKTENRLE